MRLRTLAILSLLGSGACNNSCQALCVRLAHVAETDGGIVFPAEDLTACIEEQAGSESRDDRKTCRSSNSKSDIRDEWTCEDMDYFFGVDRNANVPNEDASAS